MLLNLPMAIGELSSSKVGHDILRCVFLFIDHFLSESSIAVPSSESTKATELAIRESVIDLSKSICSAMPSSLCCCSSPSSRFFIFLRHILSTIISLSLAIWVLSTALLVLYFFHKMYFPSIHCISGIVLTISSTSSSFITDLQAVLLMALAISLILTGTLK